MKKTSFGLSLNSAFFGFYAHAGFMKGFEELKLEPKMITGSSAGSIIGSLYAAKIPMKEVCEFLIELKKEDFWEGTNISQILKPFRIGLKNYSGLLTGLKLKKLLHPFLGNKLIEDLPIKLGIVVSNLTNQKRELLTSGNILDAIIASSAFPLMFEIQKIGNHEFTDGGLVDHEPIKEMILHPRIEKIFTHSIKQEKPKSENLMMRAISNGLNIIESETDDLKNELARLKNKKIIRLQSFTKAINQNKLHSGIENISKGYETIMNSKKLFL